MHRHIHIFKMNRYLDHKEVSKKVGACVCCIEYQVFVEKNTYQAYMQQS